MINLTRNTLLALAVAYGCTKLPGATGIVYLPQEAWLSKEGDVVLERIFVTDYFGLPRPRISYVETVKAFTQETNNGEFCQNKSEPTVYDRNEELGRWNIKDWAGECMADPVGYRWSADWSFHLGAIKFGSVQLKEVVLKGDQKEKQ